MCKRMKGMLLKAGCNEEDAVRGSETYSICSGDKYNFINCKKDGNLEVMCKFLSESTLSKVYKFEYRRYLTFKRRDAESQVNPSLNVKEEMANILLKFVKMLQS